MENSTKQMIGLLLFTIFAVITFFIAFFSEQSGTSQQQFRALTFSIITGTVGVIFVYLGRNETKTLKILK